MEETEKYNNLKLKMEQLASALVNAKGYMTNGYEQLKDSYTGQMANKRYAECEIIIEDIDQHIKDLRTQIDAVSSQLNRTIEQETTIQNNNNNNNNNTTVDIHPSGDIEGDVFKKIKTLATAKVSAEYFVQNISSFVKTYCIELGVPSSEAETYRQAVINDLHANQMGFLNENLQEDNSDSDLVVWTNYIIDIVLRVQR